MTFFPFQINSKNLTENSFWAKAKEDKLERQDFFNELTAAFAAKSVPVKTADKADGGEKKAAKKKAKELKILDPKSAQNLCKSANRHYNAGSTKLISERFGI